MLKRSISLAAAATAAIALSFPGSTYAAIPVIQESFQDEVGGSWKDDTGNAPTNAGLPGQWLPSGHVAHLNPIFDNKDADWSPLVQNEVGAAGPVPTGEYMASLNRTGNQTGTPGLFNMDGIIKFTLADGTPRPAVTGEKIVGSFSYFQQEGNFGFGFTNSIANLQAYQATMPVWDGGNSAPLMMPTAYTDSQSGLSGTRQWGISSDITGHIALNKGFNNLFAHAVVDVAENDGAGDGFVDVGADTPKTDPNSDANRPLGSGARQTIYFEYTVGNSVYDVLRVDKDGPDLPLDFVDILQATSVLTPNPGGPLPVGKVMNSIEAMFITGANSQLTEVWYDDIFVEIVTPTASAVWGVDADGNWSLGTNWTGGTVPNGVDAAATFGSAITAAHTVTVDSAQTVGTITFDNANSYTIAGSSPLTLDVGSGEAAIAVLAGSHTISAPITLNDNLTINSDGASSGVALTGSLTATGKTITKIGAGTAQFENVRAAGLTVSAGSARIGAKSAPNSATGTSVVNSLSVTAGASLDLTNNSLVLDYTGTSPIDTVRQQLADGRITSSSSDANKKLGYGEASVTGFANGTFAGQSVDADAVLVKFTYGGDSNLDGKVDVGDLGNLASNWQQSALWTGGDFDYNGTVNVGDLGILATNWQQGVTTPTLGPSLSEALAALGLGGVSVPEPAAVSLAGLALLGAIARRVRA